MKAIYSYTGFNTTQLIGIIIGFTLLFVSLLVLIISFIKKRMVRKRIKQIRSRKTITTQSSTSKK